VPPGRSLEPACRIFTSTPPEEAHETVEKRLLNYVEVCSGRATTMDVGFALAGLLVNVLVGTTGVELTAQARPLTGWWPVFRHVSYVTLTAPALAGASSPSIAVRDRLCPRRASVPRKHAKDIPTAAPRARPVAPAGSDFFLPDAAAAGAAAAARRRPRRSRSPRNPRTAACWWARRQRLAWRPAGAAGYQWQRSTDGGMSFTNATAATAASHTTPATVLADDGARHRVVVSGAAGSVNSNPALLSVMPAPVAPSFSAQPSDQTVTAPAAATFTVAAAGVRTPALQWQSSTDGGTTFADIAGATAAYAVHRTTGAFILIDEASNATFAAGLIE
jgi:hypothetical protein